MSEFEILIRHYTHEVFISFPGYDAAVSLKCKTCDTTLLSYADPEGIFNYV